MRRRRRFSEREVVEVLLQQGAAVRCKRCQQYLTLGQDLQREHFEEFALGGADEVGNCFFSHKDCHHLVTNGTKFNRAGSSKNKIAKAKRAARRQAPCPKCGGGDQLCCWNKSASHFPKRRVPQRPPKPRKVNPWRSTS